MYIYWKINNNEVAKDIFAEKLFSKLFYICNG